MWERGDSIGDGKHLLKYVEIKGGEGCIFTNGSRQNDRLC